MEEKTHSLSKWGHAALILMILSFAYAAVSYVQTYSKTIEPGSFRSFTVSGEGTVVAIPDVAQFSVTVLSEGDTDLSTITNENVKKMNAIIAFTKEQGVLAKDIKTTGYTVTPRYQRYSCNSYNRDSGTPCPPPEIVGYSVRESATIKVRDFDKVGTLLSGAVDKGANTVSQLTFTIDDETDVQNEARTLAIQKAQDKARSIAQAGGFNVGRLLGINEGGSVYPQYSYAKTAMFSEADTMGSAIPSIEAGSQEIVVNISLTYEIK